MPKYLEIPIQGQPGIYFPIGDHDVSWCRSHTNPSWVIATLHIVASHMLSFRQIPQFRLICKEGSPVESDQNKAISVHVLWASLCHRSALVLWSSHQKTNFLHCVGVTAVKCTIVPVQRNNFKWQNKTNPKIHVTGILFVCNEPGRSILYCAHTKLPQPARWIQNGLLLSRQASVDDFHWLSLNSHH